MVTMDMLNPKVALRMGQRWRVGEVIARSEGSGGVPDLMVNSDARGAPAAFPGHGGLPGMRGGYSSGTSSFGGTRYQEEQAPGPFPDGIGGPGGAYGGGWADGVLTVRDRHVMTRRGYSRSSAAPSNNPQLPNRLADGPDQPQYQMVNTTESWQIGTDRTTQEDNSGQHNSVDVMGRPWKRFPLGTQDGSLTLVMGPPLGTWREYGVRGVTGVHGPEPDVIDPNWVPARGAGGGGGRGLVTTAGAQGMQPADRRFVYGGVPHGLHSPTVSSRQFTMSRQASIPQMQPPRVDRPASSRIAGQSMSQMYPAEGQPVSHQTPRMASPGRSPGLVSRFMART